MQGGSPIFAINLLFFGFLTKVEIAIEIDIDIDTYPYCPVTDEHEDIMMCIAAQKMAYW